LKDVYAAKYPEIKPTDKKFGFSFFELIKNTCDGVPSLSLHRLCTLVRKMGVKWWIQEELLPNNELRKETEAIKRRCGQTPLFEFIRWSFFDDLSKEKIWSKKASKNLLAYVVIVKVKFDQQGPQRPRNRIYIYESVIQFPSTPLRWKALQTHAVDKFQKTFTFSGIKNCLSRILVKGKTFVQRAPVTNYYYHCTDTFETTIGTQSNHIDYKIKGTYFAQQNDLTSVCAHVSLQMAINNAPNLGAGKITSERINELLNIDHTLPEKRVGHFKLDVPSNMGRSAGLTTPEIIDIADKLGLNTLFANFLHPNTVDCYKWIYPQIDSSFPTILGIQKLDPNNTQGNVNHVVTVLGHTINSDRWEPEARSNYRELAVSPHFSTCDWTDHFIINDDNLGMGRTLATEQLKDTIHRKQNCWLHASMAISIVPKRVICPGINAELWASAIVHDLINIIQANAQFEWQKVLSRRKISCRTFACPSKLYIKHFSLHRDNFGNNVSRRTLNILERNLPSFFWVTEISVPDLFCGNKAKLGDVISRVDFAYTGRASDDLQAVKFVWLPGFAVLGLTPPQELEWPLVGYIPLQRSAHIAKLKMEW
jgi:hypothetical protein